MKSRACFLSLVAFSAALACSRGVVAGCSGRIVVEFQSGVDPLSWGSAHGVALVGQPACLPGCLVYQTDPAAADALCRALRSDPAVKSATALQRRARKVCGIPNDPLFSREWHLLNTGSFGTAGIDVNVTGVWGTFGGEGIRGAGIRVGIVDDGLQTGHPDLVADAENDADWNDATPDDANPVFSTDNHGTSVAGVVSATANNGYGISGVAPEALVVGERLLGGDTELEPANPDDWQEAMALTHLVTDGPAMISIKNCSWGVPWDLPTIDGPEVLTRAALRFNTTFGRGGLGTVNVFAAGNGGNRFQLPDFQDSNRNGYANSPYTICVGAIDEYGAVAYYSEAGANLTVCAPGGNGSAITDNILTTDRTGVDGTNLAIPPSDGNFTRFFAGTSAAAPVVSGVCALMLQKRPDLGWRDVQEILIATAKKNSAASPGWQTNSAGYHFHHEYGAGLVDAGAAVAAAATWAKLGPWKVRSVSNTSAAAIPDNDPAGLSRTFEIAGSQLRAERVTLRLTAVHTSRGQLTLSLTSPSGTTSILSPQHTDWQDNYAQWAFSTVQMWGEPSDGTWTLKLVDKTTGETGSFVQAELRVFGTSPVPDAYESWRMNAFGAAAVNDPAQEATVWGDLADADGDGFSTITEAALGTNPTVPDRPAVWSAIAQNGVLIFDFPAVANPAVAVVAEWSDDLVHWHLSGDRVGGIDRTFSVLPNNGALQARLSLPGLTTAAIRLRVARQVEAAP